MYGETHRIILYYRFFVNFFEKLNINCTLQLSISNSIEKLLNKLKVKEFNMLKKIFQNLLKFLKYY